MKEIWKPIIGYEGLYEVSNYGNIKSLNWRNRNIEKCLYLKKHNKGYFQVELVKNKKRKMVLVHRLVAEAFLENPLNKPQINHKDYNRSNNSVENLEWCTINENMTHSAIRRKSKPTKRKEKIIQLDLQGNIVKIWNSCVSIKTDKNYHQTSIFECCEGKRKTAYGFIWQYAI